MGWVVSQPNFELLYTQLLTSNYIKKLKPSIDRIDDYKPYTFDNIQIMMWGDNKAKGSRDRRNGINNKDSKAVVKYDIDGSFICEIYSIMEAGRRTGIGRTSISKACRGIQKTAGGYKWKYAEIIQNK
jgi:hypothetical protein